MKHKILCIDRACGSGGKRIGQLVAERLGINIYGSNLLELAKEHGEIESDVLDQADEKKPNIFTYKLIYEGNENVIHERPAEDMLFQLQSDVINKIAQKEDCVIVGRCADVTLKGHPDVELLSVFITAPHEARVIREMDCDHLSRNQARKSIRTTDESRRRYYYYNTHKEWGAKDNYDLVLNSDALGLDRTVDILCDLMKKMDD